MGKLLSQDELDVALVAAPGWALEGDEIAKTFNLPTFTSSIVFAAAVANLAERADHHPDILIQYRKVTLTLSTHSAGGLTDKDFDLAREIDAISR